MATQTAAKKPASKAKAKTTKTVPKKPASYSAFSSVKATSKRVANKTSATKKVVAKKEDKVVSSAVSSKRTATPFDKIRALHLSNFLSGVVLSVMTIVFITPTIKDFILNYQARDSFVSTDKIVFSPASETMFSLDLRWMLVVILGLTGLVSLVLATKWYKRYETSVKSGISGLRWLLYGFVWALVLDVASVIVGVQDLMTLKTIAGLGIAAAIFAWLAERENNGAKSPKKLAFWAAVFTYFMAVLPMLWTLVSSYAITSFRFTGYVYVVATAAVIGTLAIILNLKSSIFKKKQEYIGYEQRYLRIDQIAKFVMILAIFAALNK